MRTTDFLAVATGLGLLALSGLISCTGSETSPEPVSPQPEQTTAQPQAVETGGFPTPKPLSQSAKTPAPVPASPDAERALVELQKVCKTYGSDPENPWAVAHAILAFGPELTLSNGEPAVDYLYARYGQVYDIGGERLPSFPAKTADGIPVEPHTDLILKAVTESGLPPERQILVQGETFTLGDHWEHSLRTTFLDKNTGASSYTSPNDMPWGVQALASWGTPHQTQWEAYDGTDMDLDDLVKFELHVLTSESTFLYKAMLGGQSFKKERQGVFNYTCGGAHLVQGAVLPIAQGYGNAQDREKLASQGAILAYRYPIERDIYAQARKQAPSQSLVLYVQELKFIGHWLESMHKLMATGIYTPTATDQLVLTQAVGDLIETTAALKRLGALDNAGTLRESNEQLYLDIVGDSCHAVRGLELALGRGEVRW